MEFNDFHKWVHRELGINLLAYKPEQLERRITSSLGRININSLEEYVELIKKDSEQRQKFLDFITINVTEIFRNPELFSGLEKVIRDELLIKNNNLKIWSAACSIGCEPYSIAIILKNLNAKGNHKIIATDIDNTILNRAKKAEYTDIEMKNVSRSNLEKYFTKEDKKYYLDNTI